MEDKCQITIPSFGVMLTEQELKDLNKYCEYWNCTCSEFARASFKQVLAILEGKYNLDEEEGDYD